MSLLKYKQLQHECETWKRTLRFMIEENIHLKSRLSELIQAIPDHGFLSHAEKFHNDFLKQDDLIALLRSDISEFYELLLPEKFNDEIDLLYFERKFNVIRNNIVLAENRFNTLKIDFHACMLRNI